jgi:hypothetical protein
MNTKRNGTQQEKGKTEYTKNILEKQYGKAFAKLICIIHKQN